MAIKHYFGQAEAQPLLRWVNSHPGDFVSQLLDNWNRPKILAKLLGVLAKKGLLVPAFNFLPIEGNPIAVRIAGNLRPGQRNAIGSFLWLGQERLLRKLRCCARPGCTQRFFATRSTHRFCHSQCCRLATNKTRLLHMRESYRREKEREAGWLSVA